MNRVFNNILLISFFIIFNFSFLNAAEIEILSDVEGTGPEIKNHYKVTVHYRGSFLDETEFDSSFKRNQPFVFQIGTRQVITGWEKGIIGMKVGGKRRIKIPPELAYGKRGHGEVIPPNSTLIFDIEIIVIKKPSYEIISGQDLLLKQKKGLIVIDIRTEEEWKKTGIIKGSKKITAFDSQGNARLGPDAEQISRKNLNYDTDSNLINISNKRNFSIFFSIVKSIAYDKYIFNFKTNIFNIYSHLIWNIFIKQGADFQ